MLIKYRGESHVAVSTCLPFLDTLLYFFLGGTNINTERYVGHFG